MSFGGIKRTPADAAFSDCVREANDYTCERCGKNVRSNPRSCHMSHFYGRRHKSVRWDKNNGSCLCSGCHRILGESPHDHREFIKKKLGAGLYDILTEKANKPRHGWKGEEGEIKKHYKEQLKEIQKKRDSGVTGFIDFISYD